jgi:hypothetical protein
VGDLSVSVRTTLRSRRRRCERHDPAAKRATRPGGATAYEAHRHAVGDRLIIRDVATTLRSGPDAPVRNLTRDTVVPARHRMSPRQVETVIAGGRIPQAI